METLAAVILALMIMGPFVVILTSKDFFRPLPYNWCNECDSTTDPDTGWCQTCRKVRPK